MKLPVGTGVQMKELGTIKPLINLRDGSNVEIESSQLKNLFKCPDTTDIMKASMFAIYTDLQGIDFLVFSRDNGRNWMAAQLLFPGKVIHVNDFKYVNGWLKVLVWHVSYERIGEYTCVTPDPDGCQCYISKDGVSWKRGRYEEGQDDYPYSDDDYDQFSSETTIIEGGDDYERVRNAFNRAHGKMR